MTVSNDMLWARFLGKAESEIVKVGAMTGAAAAQFLGIDRKTAGEMEGEGTYSSEPEPEPDTVTLSLSFAGLTVQQVVDAVGSDPVLAQAALDEELGKGNPRSTLVSQLLAIIEGGE